MSSSYNYAEPANVNLVCCICRSPFAEPCTTRTCCHTFCYDCIAQAISINHQCPIDRTSLTLHDLVPADPLIRNLVDELIVRCPQESLGCSHTCQRHLLPVHLRDACQYVNLPCPHACCAELVLRKDIDHHRCSQLPSVDPETQGEQRDRKDSTRLKTTESDNATPASPVFSARLSPTDLAAENATLRLRLSALENVVHTLRSEMFAVKCALGPWYRPDLQPQLESDEQSADLEASQTFERQLAEELSQPNGYIVTETPSPPAVRDRSDISSYFPPAEDEVLPPTPSQSQRQHIRSSNTTRTLNPPFTSSVSSPVSPVGASYASVFSHASLHNLAAFTSAVPNPGTSYTLGTSHPVTSTAAISIPPLDPSTPLPDTLASLHASLVTTAGALGAFAAARGAEALRTADEMRGLRGAMHGLRMQVHDILTSRTHQTGLPNSGGSNDAGGGEQYNMASPGWLGYGSRPFGMPPMLHHPPFGVPSGVPPTNITKL